MPTNTLNSKTRKIILDVLEKIDPNTIVGVTWDRKEFSKVHGAGTSTLGGYGLGSLLGGDDKYHVGIFEVKNKQLVRDSNNPWVHICFQTQPDSQEMIETLITHLKSMKGQ